MTLPHPNTALTTAPSLRFSAYLPSSKVHQHCFMVFCSWHDFVALSLGKVVAPPISTPGKADTVTTSPIGATALWEATSSGSGRTRGLCPTEPVPAGPPAHSASPAPLSFFASIWEKLSKRDQATVRCISAEDIMKSVQKHVAAHHARQWAACERENDRKVLRAHQDSVTASIDRAKAELHSTIP